MLLALSSVSTTIGCWAADVFVSVMIINTELERVFPVHSSGNVYNGVDSERGSLMVTLVPSPLSRGMRIPP